MAEDSDTALFKVKAQILLGGSIAIGPGKADLLEAIDRTGSIAAAGRALGFSYRRTGDMIDTLNACWRVPIVEGVRGGSRGGGARLTEAGKVLLEHYRALDAAIQTAAAPHAEGLLALLGRQHEPGST